MRLEIQERTKPAFSCLSQWQEDRTRLTEFRERAGHLHVCLQAVSTAWEKELVFQEARLPAIIGLLQQGKQSEFVDRAHEFAERLESMERIFSPHEWNHRSDEIIARNIETYIQNMETYLPRPADCIRITDEEAVPAEGADHESLAPAVAAK